MQLHQLPAGRSSRGHAPLTVSDQLRIQRKIRLHQRRLVSHQTLVCRDGFHRPADQPDPSVPFSDHGLHCLRGNFLVVRIHHVVLFVPGVAVGIHQGHVRLKKSRDIPVVHPDIDNADCARHLKNTDLLPDFLPVVLNDGIVLSFIGPHLFIQIQIRQDDLVILPVRHLIHALKDIAYLIGGHVL